LLIGAGTVINQELARKAINAGAKFIVSPGLNPATINYCKEYGTPIIPGVNDASSIEAGIELGLDVFKFFPAENSGGAAMLKALATPFSSVSFVPTGGIDASKVSEYAKLDAVLAIGGSWMVKADLINEERWDDITNLCCQAVLAVQGFSFAHIGINHANAAQAEASAKFFENLGFMPKDGVSSIFASSCFELLKNQYRGTSGHIAIKCNNIERAMAYLSRYGFTGVQETAKVEKGRLKVLYLDKEVGGFAIHLVRD
jgi:2-dehydro-3-deoxyphosphogluconate aldolase/(4S)-4-hydroxy-2-oxoglutarate aldolase